jgi:hypothetical protein
MVAEFQGAVANFVQLGEMLVSDHAKLVAAAQDFGTNPAYSVKDANTLTQSVNTFQAASPQKIIKDLIANTNETVNDPGGYNNNPAVTFNTVSLLLDLYWIAPLSLASRDPTRSGRESMGEWSVGHSTEDVQRLARMRCRSGWTTRSSVPRSDKSHGRQEPWRRDTRDGKRLGGRPLR